jgi:hypothetical protein
LPGAKSLKLKNIAVSQDTTTTSMRVEMEPHRNSDCSSGSTPP